VRGERFSWRWAIATFLAVLGCALLIAGGSSTQVDPLGILLALLVSGDLSWLATPSGISVALHLGLVTVALAYSLFARGLVSIPVGAAGPRP